MFNTMQAGTDSFEFRRRALLKSKTPLDFKYETSITGFNISGTEPEGCNRRVIFSVDDQLYRFGNSGLDLYEDRGELEDILEGGNTAAELLAVTNIPDWAGKKVYPIIALDAPADSPVMPRIKISCNVNSFNDVYMKSIFSPVYDLKCNGAAKIVNIVSSITTNGNAVANVYARIFNPFNQSWTDYDYLPNFTNKFATQIQFRVDYRVTTLDGSDYAELKSIKCFYTTDADKLSGSTQEIISIAQDYPADLKTCYLLVKHSELIDAELKAYVNFSAAPKRREDILIGTGTGENQKLYLMFEGVVDQNILQSSIHLDIGGKTFSDFYFDTADSSITLTADEGQEIYASWDCGYDNENWLEMAQDFIQQNDGVYSSRFIYRLTNNTNKRVAAVKIVLTRLAGNSEGETLGTGTGETQTFVLRHTPKPETLIADGAWRLVEGSNILQVTGNIGSALDATYDWQGELPKIYSYVAGWQV